MKLICKHCGVPQSFLVHLKQEGKIDCEYKDWKGEDIWIEEVDEKTING